MGAARGGDVDLNSRLSNKFFRRSKCLNTLEIPSMSEVKAATGAPLAKLIFEETHKDLKKYFGLIPFLKGPEGDLWMSPSDLLIGKVCLKPPLTQKHVKALTHQGICEIASVIEEKLLNENRIEQEAALRKKEESMLRVFEMEKEALIKETEDKIKVTFDYKIKQMKSGYEHQICLILWQCGVQVEDFETEMDTTIATTNEKWKRQIDEQIQATIKRITEEFLIQLQHQEETLAERFNAKIQCLKTKQEFQLKFERRKNKELMLQLRHKLQCQNVANLMYLLCKERHKCEKDKKIIYDTCHARNKEKDMIIQRNNVELTKISKQKKDALKRLDVRERCLVAILREFRKFIYFALKAAPTQGEFLLNLDKLLKFELVNYCLDETKTEDETIKDETQILDEKETTEQSLSEVKEEESEKTLSEINQLQDNNELPIVYFNKKMYVREDFRDLVLTNTKIDSHHPLWNEDVEELLKIFRKTVDKKTSSQNISNLRAHQSSVRFHSDKLSVESTEKARSQTSSTTSPYSFEITSSTTMINNTSSSTNQELELEKVTLEGSRSPSNSSKRIILKTSDNNSITQLQKSQEYGITLPDKSPSRIVGARDSLIIHLSTIERKSLCNISKPTICSDESNEKCLKDPTKEDLDSSSVKKHASKLVLATDSLEIIKSTIAVVKESTKKAPKKKIRNPMPTKPLKITKPSNSKSKKVNIFGNMNTREHEKPDEVFTDERIKSLVRILKESPSLMRLFTSCSK